jgi:predicted nucleotidyltransferase
MVILDKIRKEPCAGACQGASKFYTLLGYRAKTSKDTCMENYNYINQLLEALKQPDPYRIILFGPYAKETADENSDNDMVVILDNNDVAKTYEEILKKKLYIKKLVRNINYKIALGIPVYSKEEYKIIKNYGNYFIDEIEKTGEIIHEKAS